MSGNARTSKKPCLVDAVSQFTLTPLLSHPLKTYQMFDWWLFDCGIAHISYYSQLKSSSQRPDRRNPGRRRCCGFVGTTSGRNRCPRRCWRLSDYHQLPTPTNNHHPLTTTTHQLPPTTNYHQPPTKNYHQPLTTTTHQQTPVVGIDAHRNVESCSLQHSTPPPCHYFHRCCLYTIWIVQMGVYHMCK